MPDFRATQAAFMAYIRDPEHQAPPSDVSPERMATYRELFFNNIESFLATGFPVTKVIMRATWPAVVQDFFSRHKSRSPLFVGIAEEFLNYLEQERQSDAGDPPFLLELAHYEWVELALEIAEAEPPELNFGVAEDPLVEVFSLSPVAWPLIYRFPVHRICPEFQPLKVPEQPSYLVVYRDSGDSVRFLEINEPTYRLLEMFGTDEGVQGRDGLTRLAQDLGYPDPTAILEFGTELLSDLEQRGVIGRH